MQARQATDFDDLEDEIFRSPYARDGVRAVEVAEKVEAAATLMNWEPCAKCRGTGSWGTYKRMPCYACKGTGKRKPGGNARSAAAAKAKITAENNARVRGVENVDRFGDEHPAEWEWLKAASNRGDQFAESLIAKLRQFGSLTDNQLQAIRNSIAKAAERKVAIEIDVTGLDAAFAQARANGAKRASLRTEHVTFSLAGPSSTNPGSVYAKARHGAEYLGKIVGGKFSKSFACSPAHVEQIVEAARDPKGAALRYAAITGECSVCGATLTDPESVKAGIGPICSSKFGW